MLQRFSTLETPIFIATLQDSYPSFDNLAKRDDSKAFIASGF